LVQVATQPSRPISVTDPAPPALAPGWPEGRLEGDEAKRVLLGSLRVADAALDKIEGYTCLFHKQERLSGKLGEEQTMEMKVRNEPFAVYLKFLTPQGGKEVVYCSGRHENKVIAHTSGGLSRLLLPRLAVPPSHPLALADNRHPITDAGLAALLDKLIRFRQMDLTDPEAVTIIDRTTDSHGKPVLRSIHSHPNRHADRPFQRVEVLYDPGTKLPIQITNYDWPELGQVGPPLLAEHYEYENLNLDADLDDLDFDPANPEYAFQRY
jgi:hypothetical protein